jgi:hypothetical protein
MAVESEHRTAFLIIWSPACLAVAVLEFGPIAANVASSPQTEMPGGAMQGEASQCLCIDAIDTCGIFGTG